MSSTAVRVRDPDDGCGVAGESPDVGSQGFVDVGLVNGNKGRIRALMANHEAVSAGVRIRVQKECDLPRRTRHRNPGKQVSSSAVVRGFGFARYTPRCGESLLRQTFLVFLLAPHHIKRRVESGSVVHIEPDRWRLSYSVVKPVVFFSSLDAKDIQ